MGTARRHGSSVEPADSRDVSAPAGVHEVPREPPVRQVPPAASSDPYRVQFTRRPERRGLKALLPAYVAGATLYLLWLATSAELVAWIGPIVLAPMLFNVFRTTCFLWMTGTILDPVYRWTQLDRSVDALITTSSEPIEVVEQTIRGALAVEGIRDVHVLDDGGRDQLETLTERLGAVYHARGSRAHAKGGNLNYGLQFTDAEFLLILDADHVPVPTFLARTLGYLDDETVSVVQTPQDYYNDSFLHRATRRGKWGEQDIFYKCIQPSKNRWNAAFFVGTSAVLRRRAIDEVGGFSTETATEDIHTAIRMHARGWKSVFVSEVLASGIEVESLRELYQQRRRWAAGSMGLLLRSGDSPLRTRGLTMAQRFNYIDSMLGHQQGSLLLTFQLIPIVCSLTLLAPFSVSAVEFVVVTTGFVALTLLGVASHSRGTFHLLHTQSNLVAVSFSNIAGLLGAFMPHERFRPARKNARPDERTFVKPALWSIVVLALVALGRDIEVLLDDGDAYEALAASCAVFVIVNVVVLLDFLLPLQLYERRSRVVEPPAEVAPARQDGVVSSVRGRLRDAAGDHDHKPAPAQRRTIDEHA